MGFGTAYLSDAAERLKGLKELAERALRQVRDEELHRALDAESNSLAALVMHLSGNLRSRWTDFLTTDGEKPDRNRDAEFEPEPRSTRSDLMRRWDEAWAVAFATLASLTEQDLGRSIRIRNEVHTVIQAINRQIVHAAYHVGQMVMMAKHFRGEAWETLSIPRRRAPR